MTNKLEKDSYYTKDDISLDFYREAQIKRHLVKLYKKRDVLYYEKISETIKKHSGCSSEMICLGTRNNHERDSFKKLLPDSDVYSLDISEKSGSDFICDFNFLPEEWTDKWEIVFSNSIDHAINATDVFFEWLRIVKPEGMLVLGFSIGLDKPESTDCNTFNKDIVNEFFSKVDDLVEIVDSIDVQGYYHLVLKKK